MQAFISGMAARVAFVEGSEVTYIDADRPYEVLPSSLAGLRRLLLEADDVQRLRVRSREESFPHLLTSVNFDRGLRLLDVAFTDEDESFRLEAIHLLEKILAHEPSADKIKNYVLATTNDFLPEESVILKIRQEYARYAALVDEIRRSQVNIIRFHSALENAFRTVSLDEAGRNEFRAMAIDTGAFRGLVQAIRTPEAMNNAILDCYSRLSSIQNARQIIQAWTKDVIHRTTRAELRKLERDLEQFERDSYEPATASERTGYEQYRAVRQQMEAIIEKVRLRDVRAARRFADQLIRMQVQQGGHAYAAKSLSSLAVEARKMGQTSLELEWAQASVELVPDDGKGVGILADTYLHLYRMPEAEAAFKKAAALGHVEFGRAGIGRLYKASGKYDLALQELKNVIQDFSGVGASPETYGAYAETLRDMLRDEEALEAYEEAIKRYENQPILLCGKAAVLSDLGRVEEAVALYSSVSRRFKDNEVALCGLADVHKRAGQWNDALRIYSDAKGRFPASVVAFSGYADVLRARGDWSDAIVAYKEAVERFPYSPVLVNGYADTLKDMRRFPEALTLLHSAIETFSLDPRLRNSYANALKLDGRFADALSSFDKNVRDFPYDLYALGGRANLLRLLGDYDAALKAYDTIIERRPDYQFALNAKAAILVAQKKYNEAEAILPAVAPRTEIEWGTLHIRGMLALRRGDIDAAIELLSQGTISPFYRQRSVFHTALALVYFKRGELDAAQKHVNDNRDNISQLLKIHILLRNGQISLATQGYEAVNDNLPRPLVQIKATLGAIMKSPMASLPEADELLFEQEAEAILQAA